MWRCRALNKYAAIACSDSLQRWRRWV